MTDHAHHHQRTGHSHQHDAGLVELLNLDAEVLGSYLDETTGWAGALAWSTPALIVDIGAGSGAGTLALARRFDTARIVAVDKSTEMLGHTLAAARGKGLDGRVSTVQADLDEAWPALPAADLIWAASSLHELANPERTMRQMFAGLNPGGLLVVIEMDALPRFLPNSLPDGGAPAPDVEARLHQALTQIDWNPRPDWRVGLERAGFDVVGQRTFSTVANSTPELTARFAQTFLGRIRPALDGVAATADLAVLDRLLASDGPESLAHRTDLDVRGTRTAWIARKP